ncbi:hypothetical protein [Carnobacterium inhibens]|uniref:hypothetical protein n=1 Tax=Carnobacterium inhibens TaxID=147709 RepID=UPI000551C083|nr:hypothetical protein [Carnobacterium inhibens]
MIKIFGKEYAINSLLYGVTFVCSIIIIVLNSLFFIFLKESIFNLSMLTGILLFISSGLNLFSKKKGK